MTLKPNDDTILISFDVSREDIIALVSYYYASSPSVQQLGRKRRIQISGIFIAVGAACIALSRHVVVSWVGVWLFFSGIISALLYPSWHQSGIRRAAEKAIEESQYQKRYGEYKLVIGENGFSCTSPLGESFYQWIAVDRSVLTPDYLFIYLAGPSGYSIRRTPQTDDAIAKAKAFVDSHITDSQR